MVDIIDYVLKYAGKKERVGDLFGTGNIMGKFTNKMKRFKV
jgi:hypothetical protein